MTTYIFVLIVFNVTMVIFYLIYLPIQAVLLVCLFHAILAWWAYGDYKRYKARRLKVKQVLTPEILDRQLYLK